NISPHGTGRNAMENFYTKNKIYYQQLCWENSGFDRYVCNYYSLIKNQYFYCIIIISEYHFKDLNKFFYSITKKVPVLFFTRDPIGVIKHAINGIRTFYDNQQGINITLKDKNFDFLFKNLYFWKYIKDNGTVVGEQCASKIPILKNIKPYLKSRGFEASNFFQNSILKSLKHCTKELYFIDINDITKNRINQTMSYFAKQFGFNLNKNQKSYNQTIYHPINALLPFILNISNNLKIIITTYQKNIRKNRNRIKDFCDFDLKYDNIYIDIEDKEIKILKQNMLLFLEVKSYIKEFICALEKKIDEFENKKINENDILIYIKKDRDLMLSLKKIFDQELAYIKQHRPDIVASWKYYQEFEKMCKELDSNI
ncbi:DUF2972 domain-containing protein, partial [Campylobacter jejuni]|nr:DUF2972 domain-containing protein [Campylobacter jejuni]